jgi:hypothetical protein
MADQLGISKKFVRNLLSIYRADFPERTYTRAPNGQRMRLLSPADRQRFEDCLVHWRTLRRARERRAVS